MTDETTFLAGKWRCSACGCLNSMERDNVCWRCMARALEQDAEKLTDLLKPDMQTTEK